MKCDEFYIREAIKEAQKAVCKGEVPVGCVIVIDDCIVARAHNLCETNNSNIEHAEILAIKKACRKLNTSILDEATIYITLEPCLMCAGAIYLSRIKKVVFGAYEPKFGVLGSIIDISEVKDFNHNVEVKSGVLSDEIAAMMKTFFRKIRDCSKS